ncbi:MAG: hypothetical protein WC668_02740 [Patescibacteria group bacterium]
MRPRTILSEACGGGACGYMTPPQRKEEVYRSGGIMARRWGNSSFKESACGARLPACLTAKHCYRIDIIKT